MDSHRDLYARSLRDPYVAHLPPGHRERVLSAAAAARWALHIALAETRASRRERAHRLREEGKPREI